MKFPIAEFNNTPPQVLFDAVVDHLRTQGRPAVTDGGMCKYRSRDGLSCAVGCLILDEEYDEKWDRGGGERVADILKYRGQATNTPQAHLLMKLQSVHDYSSDDITLWKATLEANLADVASISNVIYTPPQER